MIAVVDYGMGNLHSVRHALAMAGAEVCVTNRPEELREAERIVLPGVGAFGECVKNLCATGVIDVLAEEVLQKGKPLLGICLGLQVLAHEGHEMGIHQGLGWVPGVVKRLEPQANGFKVPHVGWNEIIPTQSTPLFQGLDQTATFYFVHSYHLVPDDPSLIAALCDYGGPFTAAVMHGNLFATQFHPEKSQRNGLRLLENFVRWKP